MQPIDDYRLTHMVPEAGNPEVRILAVRTRPANTKARPQKGRAAMCCTITADDTGLSGPKNGAFRMVPRQPFFVLGKRQPGLLHRQQCPAVERCGRVFGQERAQARVAPALRVFGRKARVCIHSSSRSMAHQSR